MRGVPSWAVWVDMATSLGWTGIAVAVAFAMRRRGHDWGAWFIAGIVLGPFVIVAAVVSARRAARRPSMLIAVGATGPGATDVLVVVDEADPTAVVGRLAGLDVRRLVLAVVIGRGTFDRDARAGALRRAREALALAAGVAAGAGLRAAQLIVEGRPEVALWVAAHEHDVDLVVVPATEAHRRLTARLRRRRGAIRVVAGDSLLPPAVPTTPTQEGASHMVVVRVPRTTIP